MADVDTSGQINNNMKGETKSTKMSPQAEKWMNKVYFRIFIFLLIDLIAFTVILPLMPGLLKYYGDKDTTGLYSGLRSFSSNFRSFIGIQDAAADTVFLGGIVNSLFSFLQFLSSPIIGAASDVYGRRSLMLLCTAGVAVSYVLWMFSSSFLLFVVARFVGGISKGNVNLSMSMVTDVSNKEKRGKGMALIGISFSVGFIVGPMVGATFSAFVHEGSRGIFFLYPALFAFLLCVLDLVLMYFLLEETLPEQKRVQEKSYIWHNAFALINPASIFSFKPVQKLGQESKASVQRLGLIYFIYIFIYSGLEFSLPFLMTIRYHYKSSSQGKLFLFIGIIMIIVQGSYTRRIKANKHRATAILGMLILIPAYLVFSLAESEVLNILSLPLFGFASATVVPCLTTLISNYGGDSQKGVIMGIFRSLGSLARGTGPMFFSAIFWLLGTQICFGIGALGLLIPLLLFRGHLKEKD